MTEILDSQSTCHCNSQKPHAIGPAQKVAQILKLATRRDERPVVPKSGWSILHMVPCDKKVPVDKLDGRDKQLTSMSWTVV